MSLQYPKVKGSIVSWANLKTSLLPYDGPDFLTNAYAAVDWDEKLEPEKVKGTGPIHIGRTVGQYDANGSMSMYLDEGMAFQESLQNIAGDDNGFGEIEFDILCSWEPLNGEGRIFTVKLVGARIAGDAIKSAPGAGATVLEMPLSIDRVEKITPSGKVLRLI